MLEKEAQDWGRGLRVCPQEFLIMSHVPDLSLKPIRCKNMCSLKIQSELAAQGIILKDEREPVWTGRPPLPAVVDTAHRPGKGWTKHHSRLSGSLGGPEWWRVLSSVLDIERVWRWWPTLGFK